MALDRRTLVGAAIIAATAGPVALAAKEGGGMYGLIGKMRSQAGRRAALVEILLEGVSEMPGCLSYVVANDPADGDLIWITEVWETREAHAASLSLPSVREAIARARPLIAGMDVVGETVPVGGHGLTASA